MVRILSGSQSSSTRSSAEGHDADRISSAAGACEPRQDAGHVVRSCGQLLAGMAAASAGGDGKAGYLGYTLKGREGSFWADVLGQGGLVPVAEGLVKVGQQLTSGASIHLSRVDAAVAAGDGDEDGAAAGSGSDGKRAGAKRARKRPGKGKSHAGDKDPAASATPSSKGGTQLSKSDAGDLEKVLELVKQTAAKSQAPLRW